MKRLGDQRSVRFISIPMKVVGRNQAKANSPQRVGVELPIEDGIAKLDQMWGLDREILTEIFHPKSVGISRPLFECATKVGVKGSGRHLAFKEVAENPAIHGNAPLSLTKCA
jgi:hypothetical protein